MPRQHPWERPATPEEQRRKAKATIALFLFAGLMVGIALVVDGCF